MLIEKENIYAQTGLTQEDLLSLLSEAGLRLPKDFFGCKKSEMGQILSKFSSHILNMLPQI